MSTQYSRASFQENGFAGPFRVLGNRELRGLVRKLRSQPAPADWSKGRAVTSPLFCGLATNERILEILRSLLGEDVMLWGASLVQRSAGQVHPWHTDIETSDPSGKTVSVWIGLANTNARSSLHVVSHSHGLGQTIQKIASAEGLGRDEVSEEHLIGWARRVDPRCKLVRPDMSDGDAIIFDGRLWHGSDNRNRRGIRTAVLLQYASPDTPIRIPDPAVLKFPFRFRQRPRPACIMVSGKNQSSENRTVDPPAHALGGSGTMVQWISQLDLPLDGDATTGWKPYPIFHSSVPTVTDLSCHVSVLEPGHSPHPPHRHEHEEILLALSGEPGLVVVDEHKGHQTTHSVRRGDLIYYPVDTLHTIRNDGSVPATYLMFKWRELSRSGGRVLGLELHRPNLEPAAPHVSTATSDGFNVWPVFEGATRHLRTLHCHRSELAPGAGYDPHTDPYDVAIVVLRGVIETLGERVGPNGVIFYGAGLEHGMRNPGAESAEYLVFEFHGNRGRSPISQLARRAFRAAARRTPGLRSLKRRVA